MVRFSRALGSADTGLPVFPQLLRLTTSHPRCGDVQALVTKKAHTRLIIGRLIRSPADIVRRISALLGSRCLVADVLLVRIYAVPCFGIPVFQPVEGVEILVVRGGVAPRGAVPIRISHQIVAQHPHIAQSERLAISEAGIRCCRRIADESNTISIGTVNPAGRAFETGKRAVQAYRFQPPGWHSRVSGICQKM